MVIDERAEGVGTGDRLAICSAANSGRPVRMLVPLDCRALGDAVIETAACTARLLGAEVHIIAVLPPEHEHATVQPGSVWYPSYVGEIFGRTGAPVPEVLEWRDQAMGSTQAAAEDYLSSAERQFSGLQVVTKVILMGSVGPAIVEYARRFEVDLIAMATHGRNRIAKAFLGSVATEVVHSGVAPVLLVKPRNS
jgi:nucleotide-binding universal stress UspA family protein